MELKTKTCVGILKCGCYVFCSVSHICFYIMPFIVMHSVYYQFDPIKLIVVNIAMLCFLHLFSFSESLAWYSEVI